MNVIPTKNRASTAPIAFRVDGIPKGQPRPRAFAKNINGRAVARCYDSRTAEGWKGAIALAARPHIPATPIDGPVSVNMSFYLPRPKRLCRKRDHQGPIPACCKPDIDNLAKAVFDALTTIGMWGDDAQVYDSNMSKCYHAIGGMPGAFIIIDTEFGRVPAVGEGLT